MLLQAQRQKQLAAGMGSWAAPARPILDGLCELRDSRTEKVARLASVNARLQELAGLQQELATLQECETGLLHSFCGSKPLTHDAIYWHGQLSDGGRLDSSAALAAAQAHLQARMSPRTAPVAFSLFASVVS